jgi:hypothetical protein
MLQKRTQDPDDVLLNSERKPTQEEIDAFEEEKQDPESEWNEDNQEDEE